MKWASKILLLLVLLSSCSILDSDESALRLETDRKSYELGTSEMIDVVVENGSSSVIYFSTCMPTTLEELEGNRKIGTLRFPVCECICRAELAPTDSWSYSVSVDWIEEHRDQFRLEEGNAYRLRFSFFKDKEMRKLLDKEALHTNRFKLLSSE